MTTLSNELTPKETFGTAPLAAAPPRALMPDLIRAFALIGIVLVNVMGLSWGIEQGYFGGAFKTSADSYANILVNGLFFSKSYPLFSMMFGAGLYYQLASAQRRGISAGPRYARRIIGLFVLGLLHFIFFWIGDILMTYAILGALLFAFKGMSSKVLWIIGWVLIAGTVAMVLVGAGGLYMFESFDPEGFAEMQGQSLFGNEEALATGSFMQAAGYRLVNLPIFLINNIFFTGGSVFGFFCFGLAIVKGGLMDNPAAPLWKRARLIFLPIGVIGSFVGAWVMQGATGIETGQGLLGMGLIMLFAPFSALGYAGVIAKFCEGEAGPVKRFLAKAGSASLTAYLLQSVILSLIFCGYGLGLFGQVGAATAILIALVTGIFTLAFTGIWRSFATRGPMEVLLRRFTYWGRA